MDSKNKNIVYGNFDLDELEFEPRRVKVRVTTMLDEDILRNLKKLAKSSGQKYQTLLNQILRAYLDKPSAQGAKLNEDRVRRIVRDELKKRA